VVARQALMSEMVFVPMTWDAAVDLRSGIAADHYRACAATSAFVASMETGTSIEEAEYAALGYAGVLALVLNPGSPRLVVAAEVQPGQLIDLCEPLGEVEVRELGWNQVRALFADEPAALEAMGMVSKVVAGESLAAALAPPEVGRILDEYDMLWFAPEELDQLEC
jgi:hypothetical protein